MVDNPLGLASPAWLAGVKLLAMAGFSFWLYSRVTKQDIFVMLAGAFSLSAVMTFIFLSGAKVSTVGILLNVLAFFPVFTIISAVICSKLYYHLPFWGVPPDKMVHPEKGIQLPFTIGISFLMVIILHLLMGKAFMLVESPLYGLKLRISAWILYLLLSVGAGYLITFIMPYKASRDTFVTVQDKMESVDVLEPVQEIQPVEKAAIPSGIFLILVVVPFLIKQEKTETDIIGIVVLSLIFGSFIYLQYFKKPSSASPKKR